MKYIISFIVGLVVGVALFAAGLYWNPFAGRSSVSPLAVSSDSRIELVYSLSPGDAIAFVNDGRSRSTPHPDKIQELWEPTVSNTEVLVTLMSDARGRPAGVGVKYSTGSEETRLMQAEVLVDSIWHIWLAGEGGLMIEQTENRWPWLRDVVIPATLSAADNWRGSWYGVMTAGPNAIGTGALNGGSGALRGVRGEAVEAVKANAYSTQRGAVDVDGNLTLALPRQ